MAVTMCATRLLLLLVALTATAVSSRAQWTAPTLCTPEEKAAATALTDAKPSKCVTQAVYFDVCDDDCLAFQQRMVTQAPNCSIYGAITEIEEAATRVQSCEKKRSWMSSKYVPQESPGLRNCSFSESDAWRTTLGGGLSPGSMCGPDEYAMVDGIHYCSTGCVRLIETKITNAPLCAYDGAYSAGEIGKGVLVTCIIGSKGDLVGNQVLQTVVTAGSKTSDAAGRPTASSSLAAATVAAVSAGMVVVGAVRA